MADSLTIHPLIEQFFAADGAHCTCAMFSRHGGLSSGRYDSLNVADNVGDRDGAARDNRHLVKKALAIPHVLRARQIHGSEIYCLTEPLSHDLEVDGFDALITDQAGVGLMIQQADCQAVLLFDPVRQVIAAVHCGWRGSVQNILLRVVAAMTDNYGTVPADLQALISPSLGPCCAEFINYREELPEQFYPFMVQDNYFDFWRISRRQLQDAGLAEERIRAAEICTCCAEDYFSYRRAGRLSRGVTGRNCSVIVLHQQTA